MNQTSNKIKIFALPFGGGSKYSYRALERLVPDNFEWETIELPGRGARMQEPLLTDIHAMVEDIFRQIRSRLHKMEYLVYGHSIGTLLAYELTKKITMAGLRRPLGLFLTGREAPSTKNELKIADCEKNAFWKNVQELGGLPEEILGNTELKDFFEPILRSDFKAIENYLYQPMDQPLPVPIFIRFGIEEGLSDADIYDWQKETLFMLDAQVVPGNHFFIFQHPEQIMLQIIAAFLAMKSTYYSAPIQARVQTPAHYITN